MSWEKSIADKLTGMFGSAKQEIEKEFELIEKEIAGEEKDIFEKVHADALAANNEVNKLKADLQQALSKAAKIHQDAIDAANAAKAKAEAEVARFKLLAEAHARDFATQSSAQTITPVVPAPVVETPAEPVVETPAPVVRENPQVLLAQAQEQQP
jgi:hypothetical protein